MSNLKKSDVNDDYNKWASWTMYPPKRSVPLINYISAAIIVLTAGVVVAGQFV